MKYTSIALALSLVAGTTALVGCDDELKHKEEVKVKDDGTVVRNKETVTQKPDGTVVKEEKKDVDRPNGH